MLSYSIKGRPTYSCADSRHGEARYRTTATESGGQIKCAGAIDIPEFNREIADVIEGGVDAFKLRYQKYGF